VANIIARIRAGLAGLTSIFISEQSFLFIFATIILLLCLVLDAFIFIALFQSPFDATSARSVNLEDIFYLHSSLHNFREVVYTIYFITHFYPRHFSSRRFYKSINPLFSLYIFYFFLALSYLLPYYIVFFIRPAGTLFGHFLVDHLMLVLAFFLFFIFLLILSFLLLLFNCVAAHACYRGLIRIRSPYTGIGFLAVFVIFSFLILYYCPKEFIYF